MQIVEYRPYVCYNRMVEQHAKNLETIRDMLCLLRENQSSWQLSDEQRKKIKERIAALEAADTALSVQIYA